MLGCCGPAYRRPVRPPLPPSVHATPRRPPLPRRHRRPPSRPLRRSRSRLHWGRARAVAAHARERREQRRHGGPAAGGSSRKQRVLRKQHTESGSGQFALQARGGREGQEERGRSQRGREEERRRDEEEEVTEGRRLSPIGRAVRPPRGERGGEREERKQEAEEEEHGLWVGRRGERRRRCAAG